MPKIEILVISYSRI